jgi:subtilisin family serine protease
MTLVALPSEVDQQNAVWGLDRITPPLDGIYSYRYDGTGVTAFILDTGLRTTHSEFKNGRASCGFSAYNDNCNDANGHGTHVAGTVGGITYGIAKNVNLVSVKVCGVESCQKSYILAGLDYVFGQKQANPSTPMVINLSLGGPKDSLFNDKISKTIKAGVTTVVAAGNEGANACDVSPASAKAAITVGATDKNDALASSSNRGPCVDVLAPGSSITSAWSNSNSGVNTISGTSMAAPHVTGLAVLHLSKDPSLTPTQVLKAIRTDALRNVVRIRRKILFPVLNETPNLLVTAKSLLQ